MNEMYDPKYQEKIVSKIKTIEDAIGDLTENEISAAVCAAITKVLVERELFPLKIKQFYAELAVNAIEKTEIALLIYRTERKDDKN